MRLVDDVRDRGGEALIFSSMHESGQRASDDDNPPFSHPDRLTASCYIPLSLTELNQLSGVAAILNFPLDVEVAEEEDRLERERAVEEEKDRVHAEAIS